MRLTKLFPWAAALNLISASVLPESFADGSPLLGRTESNSCHQDNCLRELLDARFSAKASIFCSTYTISNIPEPTAIPDYLENCELSPSRVSSACSCLITSTSSSTTKITSTTTKGHVTTTKATTTKLSATKSTTTRHHPTPGCTNGPKSRACWSKGYDISVDAEDKWPNTGTTVTYHLEVTNKTLSPDGTPKQMLVVNGQYPGPVITANWGDTLRIKVKNNLESNGTSMHWHGLRQLNTNSEDGADGVTGCPIPPGETRTYTFVASQHGTSWYHSHFVNQYGDGVLGPIVIKGPAVEDYDYDLGALPITDHYYMSMYQSSLISRVGRPPNSDNGLINGKNKNVAKTAGSYHTQSLEPGKKYRLRLINTSVVNHFKVHLDGHKFKVIQADFVPIVPYETDWLSINIGQRYDVVFTASKTPDNYWFRAVAPTECGIMASANSTLAIFNNGVKARDPKTTATPFPDDCVDEKTLTPYNSKPVPRDQFSVSGDSNLTVTGGLVGNFVVWTINGTGIKLDVGKPTLQYIQNNDLSYRQKTALQIFEIPKQNHWQFILVQNTNPVSHPLHLHGHDFRILGSSFGPGVFSDALIDTLNFESPPRRDTITLPGLGWLVLGFKTDNPGAWLFHCHIVWHMPEGMAIQFLERPHDIKKTMSLDYLKPECKAWGKWFKTSPHPIEPPA